MAEGEGERAVRPTELSEAEQQWLDGHMMDLHRRVLDEIPAILGEIEAERLQQRTYELAFKPSRVLPKRHWRPSLTAALLAERVHLAHAPDGPHQRTVLRLAAALHEYYDLLDDLVDGDVEAGHEGEVVLTTQLLAPIAMRLLAGIGAGAVDYWADRALRLAGSLHVEQQGVRTFDDYLACIDRQAWLYGMMGGLGAVAADAGDEAVERGEAIGRGVFRFAQLARDLDQRPYEPDGESNAARLASDEAIFDEMARTRRAIDERLSAYPEASRRPIRDHLAVDLEAWRARRRGERAG